MSGLEAEEQEDNLGAAGMFLAKVSRRGAGAVSPTGARGAGALGNHLSDPVSGRMRA